MVVVVVVVVGLKWEMGIWMRVREQVHVYKFIVYIVSIIII